MRLSDSQGPHKSGNVVGEKLGGIGALSFVRFPCPPQVERNARKVLGIFCDLEGITGVIGGQVRNENKRLAGSLLVLVYGDVVRFDLRHGNLSWLDGIKSKAPLQFS